MANPIRCTVLAALAVALFTAACTSPSEPPAPSGSAAPVPVTAAPLDVSHYLAAPCSGVPTELAAGLGLADREDTHDTILPGAGDQAQCRLSSSPPLTAAAEVRFYPTTRPLLLVTGFGSRVTTTSLDGYPAGEWVLSTGTDGSFTSCQMIVDIAQNQGIGILFNGRSGEPIATSCSKARQLAAGVIAPLRQH